MILYSEHFYFNKHTSFQLKNKNPLIEDFIAFKPKSLGTYLKKALKN